jgi:hypothetical protein
MVNTDALLQLMTPMSCKICCLPPTADCLLLYPCAN